jgi:hypothetical protein
MELQKNGETRNVILSAEVGGTHGKDGVWWA